MNLDSQVRKAAKRLENQKNRKKKLCCISYQTTWLTSEKQLTGMESTSALLFSAFSEAQSIRLIQMIRRLENSTSEDRMSNPLFFSSLHLLSSMSEWQESAQNEQSFSSFDIAFSDWQGVKVTISHALALARVMIDCAKCRGGCPLCALTISPVFKTLKQVLQSLWNTCRLCTWSWVDEIKRERERSVEQRRSKKT